MHTHSIPSRPLALVSAITVASSALATGALAQDSGNANPEYEEVLVIGQKFQNSLVNRLPLDPEKLPFSLDIVTDSAIHERGFINPLDILETVPNVVRRQTQFLPTGGSYLIRGLYGTVLTNNRPENDSRGAGRRDASQIERFEVLKGPVSVLLGPVIPGGVINQVTKTPDAEDFGEVILRGGSFGTYRLEADLNNGDLLGSEVWSGRLTVAYEDQGMPQDEAGTETLSIRPVVEANFSDRTRLQASMSYSERDSSPSSYFPVFAADGSVPGSIDEETYFGLASDQTGDDLYVDLELQHEFLNDLKLVVRGSHQDTDFDYQSSQGGSNYAGGRGFGPDDTVANVYYSAGYRDTDVSYADVQLVGAFEALGLQQDWVVGVSYQETKFSSFWAFGGVLGSVDVNALDSAQYGVPNFDLDLNAFGDREDELRSAYAEMNFRPIERLNILAGVRYDDYEVTDLIRDNTVPLDEVTFRVGGTYELSDGLNAYVSYAESFVPQFGNTRDGSPIEPETAINYEVGLKANLLDGKLRLTTSAFALTRENVATLVPGGPGQPFFSAPTGEQEHNGFEISADMQLTTALTLNVGYGYVDAEITEVINASSGQDVGDPVWLVPDSTYSAFATYTVQDGPMARLRLGLGVRAISDRPAPRFDLEYDGYTLVDGLVAYPFSDSFDVQLNVHNLLDEEYRENIGWSTGTPAGGHRFGNPRSAYVTVRARF
ncbi:MAG: TonB-dependent siderophore receptor [Pseudomonadota bacterium]